MSLGFIILRHVNSKLSRLYWIESYKSIRQLYPDNKIVIIDDYSNYEFLTDIRISNTIIVNSEFKGRGELLPYYYYSKNKWFDTAVIIHDSVFIKKPLDVEVDNYRLLWDFEHNWDQVEDETRLINTLTNNSELLEFHKNKHLWKGCFGCMSIVKYDYIKMLDDKYTLSNLLNSILNRYNRCSFERVVACMLQANGKETRLSLLGDIFKYSSCGYSYNDYIVNNKTYNNMDLPVVKVWTGR
jgi:hypothetical protein